MAVGMARLALRDEAEIKRFMADILTIKALRGEEWDIMSPQVVREIWSRLITVTGEPDPMKGLKAEQNRAALELLPAATEIVETSKDPFLDALKFAIAGNALDAMVGVGTEPATTLTKALDQFTLNPANAERFRERVSKARKIVYFIDNCGEIVFDRLFLQVLCRTFPAEVVVVARSLPILNDATVKEAQQVGIDRVARVIGNGLTRPFAGTVLAEASAEVQALARESDLVVSKGVGNYDSLTEENSLKGRITFLFHGKCIPCSAPHGEPLGALVVFNS
jgi:damage-control phosphatase, subfamily I